MLFLLISLILLSLAGGCCTDAATNAEAARDVPSESPPATVEPAPTVYETSTRLPVVDYPSWNFNDRRLPVSIIVLHYTAAPFRESLNALTNDRAKNRVSSHYLVDENGLVFRLVDESKRAWHAGVGRWGEITDVNSASIGIEIVNRGPLGNGRFQPFPAEQIASVIALCADIQSRRDIQAVVGHSDVAPVRKVDPGPLFPWNLLRAQGIKVRTRD